MMSAVLLAVLTVILKVCFSVMICIQGFDYYLRIESVDVVKNRFLPTVHLAENALTYKG